MEKGLGKRLDFHERVEAPTKQGKGVQSKAIGLPALLAGCETSFSEPQFLHL